MNSQPQPDNLDLENEGNFRKLVRVITLSHGAFSLILLRCNYQGYFILDLGNEFRCFQPL